MRLLYMKKAPKRNFSHIPPLYATVPSVWDEAPGWTVPACRNVE